MTIFWNLQIFPFLFSHFFHSHFSLTFFTIIYYRLACYFHHQIKRDFNGMAVLTKNPLTAQKKLQEYDAMCVRTIDGKSVCWAEPRRYMTRMKVEDIVAQYNAEIRGFYNYFALASNASNVCASLAFIMKMSMLKTLCWKLSISARKIRIKYKKNKELVFHYTDSKDEQKFRTLYNEGFKKRAPRFDVDYNELPQTMYVPYPTLAEN